MPSPRTLRRASGASCIYAYCMYMFARDTNDSDSILWRYVGRWIYVYMCIRQTDTRCSKSGIPSGVLWCTNGHDPSKTSSSRKESMCFRALWSHSVRTAESESQTKAVRASDRMASSSAQAATFPGNCARASPLDRRCFDDEGPYNPGIEDAIVRVGAEAL